MTRRKTQLRLSVPQLFNEAQRTTTPHGLLRYAGAFWELYAEDALGTFNQLTACVDWILTSSEKNPYIERLLRPGEPGGFVSAVVSQASTPEQGELVQALLVHLAVERSDADDHVARCRACQLVQAVMDSVSDEIDLDHVDEDDVEQNISVLGTVQQKMLDRLADTKPAVRAAAARALKRLPVPGENGDYGDCLVTKKLLDLVEREGNKDVRKAVLASLPLMASSPEGPRASAATVPCLLERTRDVADEVRKVVYLSLRDQVPLTALDPADRLLVLRRGLADRKQAVADAATLMLKQWTEKYCGGNVLALLAQLEVEQHTDVAEAVVRALIATGDLNPVQLCKEAATAGAGLRRDFSQDDALLAPGEALLWRVLCEELYGDASTRGMAAASAAGAAASIEAAAAWERYAALEEALPGSAEEMVAIITRHGQAGVAHRFATGQLMQLASTCVDFADATSRKAAAAMLHSLLTKPSSEGMVAGDSDAAQFSCAWRRALGLLLRKVHADPVELADALLMAVGQLAGMAAAAEGAGGGGADVWLQALGTSALLLELVPDAKYITRAASEFALPDVLHAVILHAVAHGDAQVRREAVRCLGLYCLLRSLPAAEMASHVKVLRSALFAWSPAGDTAEVATVAAQALGDLALDWGIRHDLLQGGVAQNCDQALDPELSQEPLLDVLLGVLQRWEDGMEAAAKSARRQKGGTAGLEAKLQLGATLVEALARLLLHNSSINLRSTSQPLGLEKAEVLKVLVRLLVLSFDPVAEPASQLRQCLPMFFQTYAGMPKLEGQLCGQEYLAEALLPAAHCAVQHDLSGGKRITAANCMAAKVMRYVLQLLEAAASGPDGQVQQVGHEWLVRSVLAEIIECCRLSVPKPYLATLCKLPLHLPVVAAPEAQPTIKEIRALAGRALCLLGDRLMRKDMEAVAERFAKLDTSIGESLGEEEIAILLGSIRQAAEGEELPFEEAEAAARAPATAARGKAPAARARGRGKQQESPSESEDDGSEGEEDDERPAQQAPRAAAPPTASRRMPARSARSTRKLKEESEGSDSSSSSEESDNESESEEEVEAATENASAAAGKRRASSDSVSALRQALQENRIS